MEISDYTYILRGHQEVRDALFQYLWNNPISVQSHVLWIPLGKASNLGWNSLSLQYVAVSCGYDTCFAVRICDGSCHLTFSMDPVGIPFGFQPIIWTFVRHTVSRCLIFPRPRSHGQVWTNHRHCQYNWPLPVPTYGSTWVVLWLLFFRSTPSTFPHKRSTHRGPFPGVPSHKITLRNQPDPP